MEIIQNITFINQTQKNMQYSVINLLITNFCSNNARYELILFLFYFNFIIFITYTYMHL